MAGSPDEVPTTQINGSATRRRGKIETNDRIALALGDTVVDDPAAYRQMSSEARTSRSKQLSSVSKKPSQPHSPIVEFGFGLVGVTRQSRFGCCQGGRFSQGAFGLKQEILVDLSCRSL
jgi:hypothetical protein